MSTLYDSASHAAAHRLSRRARRYALLGCFLASALAACRSDSLGPTSVQLDATYALASVNGNLAPATVAEGGGQQYVLLADTLRFSRAGSVARTLVYRHISATALPGDTTYRYHMTLPYRVTGDQVTIGNLDPCPANANCVGFDSGTITASGVTLRGTLYWAGEPVLRFRRLPSS